MVTINYLPTVSMRTHEYCPLVLKPGLTQFGHQYYEKYDPEPRNKIDLRVHLEAGNTYFIAFRDRVNPFPSPMVLVDKATSIKEMSTYSITKSLSDSHEN
jgi:hypothetical protein